MFIYLQHGGEEFINYCAQFFTRETNNRIKYYQLRDEFNNCPDQKYKAALFLYLNKHCYNGLCRYNSKGQYNVPFGQYDKPYFPSKEMYYFAEKSKTAEFIQSDFRQTFANTREGDLIYCDPPYIPLSLSANFTAYTNKKFCENDQIELAKLAKQSATRGIPVIISNHDTDFTRQHYKNSKIISFSVMRLISCMSRTRQPVTELIAIFA